MTLFSYFIFNGVSGHRKCSPCFPLKVEYDLGHLLVRLILAQPILYVCLEKVNPFFYQSHRERLPEM
jgi:hypothetical protein